MSVFRPNVPEQDCATGSSDPRLQPTPDYDALGSGSDLRSKQVAGPPDSRRPQVLEARLLHVAVMMAGIGLAVAVSSGGGGRFWEKFSQPFSSKRNAGISSVPPSSDIESQKPQRQAEILLERAVARSDGATNQIEARVDAWRGKLKWDAQLGELTTAALNSTDRNVRDSAIEVQLAAYGLIKNQSTVDALEKQAGSADHAKKIWALWSLGLLANRGIETDRVVQLLTAHLNGRVHVNGRESENNSQDSRRWAVEGLALVGTTPAIEPLLEAMHNDRSPLVRERAACSLAESGMFTHDQRLIAVPRLIDYADDPALDAQTRGWAYQALADITKQRLPNNSAAWRNWYQNQSPAN
ncbi:MAG TPA: HEAT repeat domain-containing protein [Candidatus Polarisedimenticolia bacterium]|nr:HEAT repeat domain-containing protein [Candidatus Polarisedimenticolia bacterium]